MSERDTDTTTSSISSFYDEQSVFVTGATGFVGKVLIEKLLRCSAKLKAMYVLVRPQRGKTAKQRTADMLTDRVSGCGRRVGCGEVLVCCVGVLCWCLVLVSCVGILCWCVVLVVVRKWRVCRSDCVDLFIYLFVFIYVCLSVCPFVCLSVCLFLSLSVCLFVHPSVCPSICLFVSLSVCMSVVCLLSVCLLFV